MANKTFQIGNKKVEFDEDKFILGNVPFPYEKGLLKCPSMYLDVF